MRNKIAAQFRLCSEKSGKTIVQLHVFIELKSNEWMNEFHVQVTWFLFYNFISLQTDANLTANVIHYFDELKGVKLPSCKS